MDVGRAKEQAMSHRRFRCLLVASHNRLMDELLTMALTDAGHALLQAGTDQDALVCLQRRHHPVIVLKYVAVPTPAGVALLPAVVAIPDLATRLAIVLLTPSAEGLLRVVEALPKQLAVCVLSMPFDLTALLNAVSQAGQRLAGNAAPVV
jgi:DNA-binding NtrC family response regulator